MTDANQLAREYERRNTHVDDRTWTTLRAVPPALSNVTVWNTHAGSKGAAAGDVYKNAQVDLTRPGLLILNFPADGSTIVLTLVGGSEVLIEPHEGE